jgi:uncharacterized peroxidase-related enzyme
MTPRIAPTTEATAPDAARSTLFNVRQVLGMLPNLYATVGHSPGALSSLLSWERALGASGHLSRREIEQLNLHVSELNGCGYCLAAHSALSLRAGLNAAEAAQARLGQGGSARENALLALARRVVRTGGSRAATEVALAREAGVSDAAIVDVLAAVALKTFTNAVASVAGTEVDFPKAERSPSDE